MPKYKRKIWCSTIKTLEHFRSSLTHFACIGVAPPQLFMPPPKACAVNSRGRATAMQAKLIKLDLSSFGADINHR